MSPKQTMRDLWAGPCLFPELSCRHTKHGSILSQDPVGSQPLSVILDCGVLKLAKVKGSHG